LPPVPLHRLECGLVPLHPGRLLLLVLLDRSNTSDWASTVAINIRSTVEEITGSPVGGDLNMVGTFGDYVIDS
jgi:hypothetical protein